MGMPYSTALLRPSVAHVRARLCPSTALHIKGIYRLSAQSSRVQALKQLFDDGKDVNLDALFPDATADEINIGLCLCAGASTYIGLYSALARVRGVFEEYLSVVEHTFPCRRPCMPEILR